MKTSFSFLPVCALVLAADASAQRIWPHTVTGTPLPSSGFVRSVDRVESGYTMHRVLLDHPDPVQRAAIRVGIGFRFRSGETLLSGERLEWVKAFAAGDGWSANAVVLAARNPQTGSMIDVLGLDFGHGWYESLRTGDDAERYGLGPDARFASLWDVRESGYQVLVRGATRAHGDETGFLLSARYPYSFGSLSEPRVHVREGDAIAGVGTLARLDCRAEAVAFAATTSERHALWSGTLADGRGVAVLDDAPIAVQGEPSPAVGRRWGDVSGASVTLRPNGEWLMVAPLEGRLGPEPALVRTGVVLRKAGDTLPAIAPYHLVEFGGARAAFVGSQSTLWYGRWDDPDPGRDEGYFLDDELLVREGDTVERVLLVDVEGGPGGFAHYVTAGGGFQGLIFLGTLADGRQGSFVLGL